MTAPRMPAGTLTPGQLEALRLAARGLTSGKIAARTGITTDAVHLRIKYACASLGAHSRTHAVALAMARGLITAADITDPTTPDTETLHQRVTDAYTRLLAERDACHRNSRAARGEEVSLALSGMAAGFDHAARIVQAITEGRQVTTGGLTAYTTATPGGTP